MRNYEHINNINDYPEISFAGENLSIMGKLGEGGTKSVYEAVLNGANVAISVPNFIDSREIRDQKWSEVKKEPERTAFLKEKGLLVNPLCEMRSFTLNGEETECLVQMPFSQLPFKVFDGKDGSSTWNNGPLDFIESPEEIPISLSSVIKDIRTLVKTGILLNRDSLSFGINGQEIRLYLFDLDGMKIDDSYDKKKLANLYAGTIVGKLDNLFSFNKSRALEQNGYDYEQKCKVAEELANLALAGREDLTEKL